jgi:hypothetical protein
MAHGRRAVWLKSDVTIRSRRRPPTGVIRAGCAVARHSKQGSKRFLTEFRRVRFRVSPRTERCCHYRWESAIELSTRQCLIGGTQNRTLRNSVRTRLLASRHFSRSTVWSATPTLHDEPRCLTRTPLLRIAPIRPVLGVRQHVRACGRDGRDHDRSPTCRSWCSDSNASSPTPSVIASEAKQSPAGFGAFVRFLGGDCFASFAITAGEGHQTLESQH